MTRRPSDYQTITRALEMLKAGILTSNLPKRLMDEFGLTPDRAHELAGGGDKTPQEAGQAGQDGYKALR